MKNPKREAADLHAYCQESLKELAGAAAERMRIPLSELLVIALVEYLHAPADMKAIPRLPLGRPRKKPLKKANFIVSPPDSPDLPLKNGQAKHGQ